MALLRYRCHTVVALIALLAAKPAAAQAGQFDLERTRTVLTGLIEQAIEDRGVSSISIALVRGDSIVWKAAFGYANARTRTPATPETIYSTGSTFKSVTATALMQLQEQGKFRLDDPVNRHLGDTQVQDRLQSEQPVTFTHILSHWSGLTSGVTTKPIWGRELPKSLEQVVSSLYSVRPPEAMWEYNNFAYGMAGLLIEKISGMEYEKYIVANVLEPLGVAIEHPVRPSPEMVELLALPYAAGGGGGKPPQPVAQVHFDAYPAGDAFLTAEDMARFLAMHLNDGVFRGKRIISATSARKMREAQFGGVYGFGFQVGKDAAGHTIISHGGGVPGQNSYMMGDVDAQVGVYYMSNSGAPISIARAALALLRGEDYSGPTERKAVPVDPKLLDRYAGSYQMAPGVVWTFVREGDQLFRLMGGGGTKTGVLAETPTRFFISGQDLTITFVANASGAVDKIEIDSGGSRLGARRK